MTVDPSAVTAAEPGRLAIGPRPGETLGKYRLDRVIGAGGMGIVWAAFDPDLERAVAIKVLRSEDSEPTLRSRLLREARAMARLKHPNVLTVYEVGTDHNRDYISMELVDGDNLDVWLSTRPPREEILDALLGAGRGLAAAHGAGLVHRDFKPHNVLRSRDGHVYVTDFGLARGHIEEAGEVQQVAVPALPDELASGSMPRRAIDSVLDSPLTQTGVLIGTPAYMAPEQFAGRIPDPRTDQFAFCITAWEALTGTRPFRGATLVELEAAAGGGVATIAADLPPRVRDVLTRGLDPDPGRRWPDLPSLLRELAAAIAPASGVGRRWLALGAASAAIATGLVIYFAQRASSSDACVPADQAFARAWSSERHAAVRKAHPGGGTIAGFVILDQVRRQWMKSYSAACAAPRTDDTREQIRCLLDVRDRVARTTASLEVPGSELDMVTLASLAASVVMCDPQGVRDMFDGFESPG